MFKTKVLVSITATLMAFTACKKDEKKSAESSETKANAPEAGKTVAPTAEKAPADTAEVPASAVKAAAPATDPSTMSREEVAEKVLVSFTKMAKAVSDANGDCEKMAPPLAAAVAEAKPVMDASDKYNKTPEDKKWFKDNYEAKATKIITPMFEGMMKCKDNASVKAAMESF